VLQVRHAREAAVDRCHQGQHQAVGCRCLSHDEPNIW
jgi:hypothetical protein